VNAGVIEGRHRGREDPNEQVEPNWTHCRKSLWGVADIKQTKPKILKGADLREIAGCRVVEKRGQRRKRKKKTGEAREKTFWIMSQDICAPWQTDKAMEIYARALGERDLGMGNSWQKVPGSPKADDLLKRPVRMYEGRSPAIL